MLDAYEGSMGRWVDGAPLINVRIPDRPAAWFAPKTKAAPGPSNCVYETTLPDGPGSQLATPPTRCARARARADRTNFVPCRSFVLA